MKLAGVEVEPPAAEDPFVVVAAGVGVAAPDEEGVLTAPPRPAPTKPPLPAPPPLDPPLPPLVASGWKTGMGGLNC